MMLLAPGSPVRRAARRLVNRVRGGAVVLLYHRVAEVRPDPQALAVSPANFAAQMEVLRRTCRVMPLRELAGCMKPNRIPPRAVAVTFDDGYADNLHRAAPVLSRLRIPATVFVASGAIGQSEPFYWDQLVTMLVHGDQLGDGSPVNLTLRVRGESHRLTITDCAACDAGRREAIKKWTVAEPAAEGTRLWAYRRLCELLRQASVAERNEAMAALRQATGNVAPGVHDTIASGARALTRDELVQLSAIDGIKIGAHTVDHLLLSSLTPDEQSAQAWASKQQLEFIIHKPVTTFSYPYGFSGSFDSASIAALSDSRMDCACANIPGVIGRCEASPMEMPRALVGDWDGQTFENQLRRWFDD